MLGGVGGVLPEDEFPPENGFPPEGPFPPEGGFPPGPPMPPDAEVEASVVAVNSPRDWLPAVIV